MLNSWLALTFKTMQLGFEAQNVIALRMMRFAAGGARGQNEARRMISEKVAAGVQAQATAVSGIIAGQKDTVVAGKVLRGLQKRVHANKRRLSRK
jgi:hypothetical protein